MSVLIVVWGSASNSSQVHTPSKDPTKLKREFPLRDSDFWSGPAERSGKSVVRYCVDGTRPFAEVCRFDLKPREIEASSMETCLCWRMASLGRYESSLAHQTTGRPRHET